MQFFGRIMSGAPAPKPFLRAAAPFARILAAQRAAASLRQIDADLFDFAAVYSKVVYA